MKIKKPEVVYVNGGISYRTVLEGFKGKQTLWYTLDQAYADFVSDQSDAALLALLIPAMEKGEDIYVEGILSEKLYHNACNALQVLLCHIMPFLKRVKIHAESLTNEVISCNRRVVTGFSGGIDSFCTLKDYYYNPDIPSGLKITDLLFSNVGSHYSGEAMFKKRYARLIPVANKIGLPFLMVNSNLDSFYNERINFTSTHSLRNASVALVLQKGVGSYLYSSAYHYLDVHVGPTEYIAYIDPISLPLMSTENMDVVSVGSEYTRVQKTLHVSDIADSYCFLDVCLYEKYDTDFTNCTICPKCLRTLSTLEIGGKQDFYSNSFDFKEYKKRRILHYAKVIASREPLMCEIRNFAREKSFSLPLLSYMIAYSGLLHLGRWLKKIRNRTRS